MNVLSQYFLPALVTLLVHGIVFAALALGWEQAPKPQKIIPPNYIEAKLVQLENQSVKKASAKKQPKKIDLTAKRQEQDRLKREAERKRQAQIEKEAAAKKTAEKKRQEELDKQRAKEAELAKQKALEQRMQQEFEEALAEEQGMLLEEEYAVEAQSFQSRMAQRVQQNWSPPPSARKGMQCVLKIQLVPTGRVVNVTISKSSGNAAFDRSAVQAVKKVETFPEIKEMRQEVFERYYRNFNFLFNPQDLRL